MSELKAIRSGEIYNIIEYEDCYRTDDLYYPKSEADKVLAELIEKNERLSNDCLIEKEIRHHKYKRCLAMKNWCSAELGMLVSTWESKIKYYKKWHKRWLELAEKFKEE